jgi:hypothetical protein
MTLKVYMSTPAATSVLARCPDRSRHRAELMIAADRAGPARRPSRRRPPPQRSGCGRVELWSPGHAAWDDRRAADTMATLVPRPIPTPVPRRPYESIADALREQIRSGEVASGDHLPTVVELAVANNGQLGLRTAR